MTHFLNHKAALIWTTLEVLLCCGFSLQTSWQLCTLAAMPPLGATAQRSSKWAMPFPTALDLFSSYDLHTQRFCLLLSLGCLEWLQLVTCLSLNPPCVQELVLMWALHCWLLPHVPPLQPGQHTEILQSCNPHGPFVRNWLWLGVQGRKKPNFILCVMIQHGATVCIREVLLEGLLIQMEFQLT